MGILIKTDEELMIWLFNTLTNQQKESLKKWISQPDGVIFEKGLITRKPKTMDTDGERIDALQVNIELVHGLYKLNRPIEAQPFQRKQ